MDITELKLHQIMQRLTAGDNPTVFGDLEAVEAALRAELTIIGLDKKQADITREWQEAEQDYNRAFHAHKRASDKYLRDMTELSIRRVKEEKQC